MFTTYMVIERVRINIQNNEQVAKITQVKKRNEININKIISLHNLLD